MEEKVFLSSLLLAGLNLPIDFDLNKSRHKTNNLIQFALGLDM